MNSAELRALSVEALADYQWKRLRYEGVLDPALDRRFRMEPPEDFLIRSLGEVFDEGFRDRMAGATDANLRRLALLTIDRDFDQIAWEQLASLSFLSTAIGVGRLARPLYMFAVDIAPRSNLGQLGELTLFHLLRALGELQVDASLVPFWEEVWRRASSANIRAIAFHGLTLSDSQYSLSLIGELVSDATIDLPVIVWSMATKSPGVIALAKASAGLPSTLRQRLRSALATAGAQDDLLQQFDIYADMTDGSHDFSFPVPGPRDLLSASQAPLALAA